MAKCEIDNERSPGLAEGQHSARCSGFGHWHIELEVVSVGMAEMLGAAAAIEESTSPSPDMLFAPGESRVATPESAKRAIAALKSGQVPVKSTSPAPGRRWTKAEDEILQAAVERFDVRSRSIAWVAALQIICVHLQGKNWKKVSECFKDRSDVQCLHRWQKVLSPELVKGPWTKEVRAFRDLL